MAAQQLQYLERMRAAQLAEDNEKVLSRKRARSFDSLIDADGQPEDTPDRDPAGEEGNTGDDAEPSEGFGKRYA